MSSASSSPGPVGVFISYRRTGTSALARSIRDALKMGGGGASVFMDTASIAPGAPWPDAIKQALDSASHVIAVIGPNWLTDTDEHSRRRIDDEEDWVRLEIASALAAGKIVIPVLVNGAGCPKPGALPGVIKALSSRQAVELRENYWDNDIELLIGQIRRICGAAQAGASPGQQDKGGGTNGAKEPPQASGDAPRGGNPLSAQKQLALAALSDSDAACFFERLRIELREYFPLGDEVSASEVVDIFAEDIPDSKEDDDRGRYPFWAVCAALIHLDEKRGLARPARAAVRHAAVALYLVAACRLVDRSARNSDYIFSVEVTEPLICAVIATALYGGELHLRADERNQPQAEYTFVISPPPGGESDQEHDFERAVYMEVMKGSSSETDIGLDGGPLQPHQRNKLNARLRALFGNIRHARKRALTLVVPGHVDQAPCQRFATRHKVPVFLHDPGAQRLLLGMTEDDLVEELRVFWEHLMPLIAADASPHRPT